MPAVLNLAAAAGMDLASSADIATNIMGAFGLGVERLTETTDTLFLVSAKANTSVEELAEAMKYAGPVANEFGWSVADTSAALGKLADAGIKGSLAGNTLKNAMTRLATGGGDVDKMFDKYNLSIDSFQELAKDGTMRMKDMAGIVDVLNAAGLEGADVFTLFGARAGSGMATLIKGGSEALKDLEANITTAGAAAKGAEIKMQGIGGVIKTMKSAWEGLNLAIMEGGGSEGMISIFRGITAGILWMTNDGIRYFDMFVRGIKSGIAEVSPFFRGVLTLITQFKNAFNDFDQSPLEAMQFGEIDKGSRAMQVFAAAIRNVTIFLEPVAPYIKTVVAAIVSIKAASLLILPVIGIFKSLGLALLANPVTASLAAIAAGATLIYSNWEGISRWWQQMWSSMQSKVADFADWWKGTTLTEKVLDVKAYTLEAVRIKASQFFQWWDNSTLKAKSPEFIVKGVDAARNLASAFISWWGTTNLEQKVASVKAAGAEAARTYLANFKSFWGVPLDAKEAELVLIGDMKIVNFISFIKKQWKASIFPDLVPKVITDSVSAALNIIAGLFDIWEDIIHSANSEEVGFKFGYAVADAALAVLDAISRKWEVLKNALRNPLDIKINMPNVLGNGGIVDNIGKAGSDFFKAGADLVGNVFDGAIQGVQARLGEVEASGADMAKATLDGYAKTAEIKSPSRVMIKYAGFLVDGLVNGLNSNVGRLAQAAGDISRKVLKSFEDMSKALDEEIFALVHGEEAMRRLEFAHQGYNQEMIDTLVQKEKHRDMLREEAQLAKKVAGELSNLNNDYKLQTISLTQGADAAKRASLEMDGYTSSQATHAVEVAKSIEVQKKWHDGLVNSISNASSVKDAFSNLGKFIKDWLKEKIAHFAANKIMTFIGIGGAGAAGGGLGGVAGGISSMFKGMGSGVGGDMAKGFLSKLGGAAQALGLGSFGGKAGVGSLSAATSTTAPTGLVGLLNGGTIGPAQASLGGLAGAAGGGYAFGDLISNYFDVGNPQAVKALSTIGSTIGMAMGGPLGAALGAAAGSVLGSAFGGKWKEVERGFEIAYAGGEVNGQSFVTSEKKQSLWRGTKQSTTFSELDDEVSKSVDAYFNTLNTTITTQFGQLGINGASSILDSFTVATAKFAGENAEEELKEWLSNSTKSAYEEAFKTLGPQLSSYLTDSIDFETSTSEEIAAAFDHVTQAATLMLPALEAVGMGLTGTVDANIANAAKLVDAMGGMSEAIRLTDLYAREFAPASDLVNVGLKNAKESLDKWNAGLDGANNNFESSMKHAIKLGYTLKTSLATTPLEKLQAAGWSMQMSAQAANAAAEQAAHEQAVYSGRVIEAAKEFKRTGTEQSVASKQLQAFTNVMEGTGGAIEINRKGLGLYIDSLDLSTQSGREAYNSAIALANSLGGTATAAIDTREEMVNYIKSLDLTTEAGRSAYAAAMLQLESIVAVENANRQSKIHLDNVAEAARNLNLNFEATHPSALAAADGIINLMGGLDNFTNATQTYYDRFYSETERAEIAMTNSAAAVRNFNNSIMSAEQGAITSGAEFRRYVESLDLNTEAGQQAYAQAMLVSEAMFAVSESGKSVDEIMSAMPANLQANFQDMTNLSATLATEIKGSNAGIVASQLAAQSQLEQIAGANITQLYAYMRGLDLSTEAGRNAYNAAMQQVGAMTALQNGASVAASKTNTLDSAVGELAKAITALKNHLAGAAGAAGSAGGNIKTAANLQAQAAAAQRNDAIRLRKLYATAYNARDIREIQGSHATGLSYVPMDGYVAELHRGEMVIPNNVASWMRNAGVPTPSVAMPPTSKSAANDDLLTNEIVMLRKELEQMRNDNKVHAETRDALLGGIESASADNVQVNRESIKTQRRSIRKGI